MTVPRLRSIILCDDVRTEITGKEIIIGVYSGSIRFFTSAPSTMQQLCLRLEYEPDPEEMKRSFRVQLLSPHGTPLINFAGHVQGKKDARGIFTLGHPNLHLSEPGVYEIKAGFDDQLDVVDTVVVSFDAARPRPPDQVD